MNSGLAAHDLANEGQLQGDGDGHQVVSRRSCASAEAAHILLRGDSVHGVLLGVYFLEGIRYKSFENVQKD